MRRYVAATRIRLRRIDYNEAPYALYILLMNSKTLDIQKSNPRRWNAKSHVGPMGKLV
jgi:hypothetical protein